MEVLSAMLNHDGYTVACAPDGEAALGLLAAPGAEPSPDVLLVDMHMPGISGRELAQRIRALKGIQPRVLAMSATAVPACDLHGFDGFLLKPLAMDDLRKAIEEHPPSTKTGRGARRTASKGRSRPSEADSVDHAVVSKLAAAMPESAMRELYDACIADTRQRILRLKELALAGNLAEISPGAHQIKGAAAMVGAVHIARLAATLESGSCKEGDTLRLLDELLGACDHLERMLLAGKLLRANDDSDSENYRPSATNPDRRRG
jgi:CheY-like chemotaxis protein/HPt (histidine-containing phosphotransfer) domain-containing protein